MKHSMVILMICLPYGNNNQFLNSYSLSEIIVTFTDSFLFTQKHPAGQMFYWAPVCLRFWELFSAVVNVAQLSPLGL